MKKIINIMGFLMTTSLVIGLSTFLSPTVDAASSLNQATNLNSNNATNEVDNNASLGSVAGPQVFAKSPSGSLNINNHNYNIFNHMNSVLTFKVPGKKSGDDIIFNVINNAAKGLSVYQSDGTYVNSFTSDDIKKNSSSYGFYMIQDVEASSDGNYLYISALYSESDGGHNKDGVIWKWNYNSGELTNIKDLTGHDNQISSSYNIDIIPGETEADDKLLVFIDRYVASGSTTQNKYLILNTSSPYTIGTGYIDSSSLNADAFRIMDTEITTNSDGSYQLGLYTRARLLHHDVNNVNYYSVKFTVASNNHLVLETYSTNPGQVYDFFETDIKAGNYKVNWLMPSLSNKTIDNSSIATFGSGWVAPSSGAQSHFANMAYPDFSSQKKNTKINDKILEGDVSNDFNHIYYLQANDQSKILASHADTINLSGQIDNAFYLPKDNQTICGFGWADEAKTKMMIYDTDGMITQYDTILKTYSLMRGIEFENLPANLSHMLPSQLNDQLLEGVYNCKFATTHASKNDITVNLSPNDAAGELTLTIRVVVDDGTTYIASRLYTGLLKSNYDDKAWKIVWRDNGDKFINKNQLASVISTTEALTYVTIGANFKYYSSGATPVIVKPDDQAGTLKITLPFANLPVEVSQTYTKTYSGFKKKIIPPPDYSWLYIGAGILGGIILISLIITIVVKGSEKKKANAWFKNANIPNNGKKDKNKNKKNKKKPSKGSRRRR